VNSAPEEGAKLAEPVKNSENETLAKNDKQQSEPKKVDAVVEAVCYNHWVGYFCYYPFSHPLKFAIVFNL
jgi:hypothetical protein